MYSWGHLGEHSVFYLIAFVEEYWVRAHCLPLHKLGNPIVCLPSPSPAYTEKTLNKRILLSKAYFCILVVNATHLSDRASPLKGWSRGLEFDDTWAQSLLLADMLSPLAYNP